MHHQGHQRQLDEHLPKLPAGQVWCSGSQKPFFLMELCRTLDTPEHLISSNYVQHCSTTHPIDEPQTTPNLPIIHQKIYPGVDNPWFPLEK